MMRILPPSRLCDRKGNCSGSLDSDLSCLSSVFLEVIIKRYEVVLQCPSLDEFDFHDRFVLGLLSRLYFRSSAEQFLQLVPSLLEGRVGNKDTKQLEALVITDGGGVELDCEGVHLIKEEDIKKLLYIKRASFYIPGAFTWTERERTELSEKELCTLFKFVGSTNIRECKISGTHIPYTVRGLSGHTISMWLSPKDLIRLLENQLGKILPEEMRKKVRK